MEVSVECIEKCMNMDRFVSVSVCKVSLGNDIFGVIFLTACLTVGLLEMLIEPLAFSGGLNISLSTIRVTGCFPDCLLDCYRCLLATQV